MVTQIIEGLYDEFYDSRSSTLVLFTRNKEKKKVCKLINGFKPYMYMTEEVFKKYEPYITQGIIKTEIAEKKTLMPVNKRILKVYFANAYEQYKVKQFIPELKEVYEADIQTSQRYIIDNIDELLPSEYRLNYFDIETTSIQGFPTYKNPVEKIISIVSFDNYLGKYLTWIWHDKYENKELEKTIEDTKIEVKRFHTEKEMLIDFITFLATTQPDFMLAWNIQFDIRYLIARCQALKINVNVLSPLYNSKFRDNKNLVKWVEGTGLYGKMFSMDDKGEQHIQIAGLQFFDLLSGYKKINAKEQESWKLDYIAKVELGEQKLRTHFDIGAKWVTDPEFIEDYNFKDVELIKRLDEKIKILQYFTNIKDSAFLIKVNDVFSSGKVLDTYVLKKYKDKYIFPSKSKYDPNRVRKPVGGGFVRPSIPGVYHNVAVFDFAGFYPNLIKTFNLSGDTIREDDIIEFNMYTTDQKKNAKQQANIKLEEAEEAQDVSEFENKMYDYDKENKLITYKIRTNKFRADLTYDVSRKGVMAESVGALMELRNKAKKEASKCKYGSPEYIQKDKIQFSYKFIINAAYGTSAYPGFRLYSNENANAITAFARMISKWVSHRLNENGWHTLAGDTDSLFIQLKSSSTSDNVNEMNNEIMPVIQKTINEFVIMFLPEEMAKEHTLEMDAEKIYKSLLLLDVKKRYIGLLKYFKGKEEEQIHFMGLDLKKSNTIKISKEAQLELAKTILKGQLVDDVFDKYYSLIKKSVDYELFKIPSKLEKNQDEYKMNTPAVRSSLWSNKNIGTKFRGGTKYFIIYVKPNKNITTDVIAFETIDQLIGLDIEIDKEKYLKDIYNKFNNLIRGIPNISNKNNMFYNRYLKNNKSLQEWF